jgi:hypothetical protein
MIPDSRNEIFSKCKAYRLEFIASTLIPSEMLFLEIRRKNNVSQVARKGLLDRSRSLKLGPDLQQEGRESFVPDIFTLLDRLLKEPEL